MEEVFSCSFASTLWNAHMEGRNVDYNVLKRILAGSEGPRHLPSEILSSITNNFSEDRKIGSGGFSDVYKGVLHDWNVAVKRLRVDIHTMDDKLFNREVQSLLKIIKHPNIVRFLGFYSNTHHEVIQNTGAEKRRHVEIRERLLCFEYISNGSLETHITDELRGLEWNIRYRIIKGICEGLQYLHNEMAIIHMDLKPANIMVDINMVPKIIDFSLARSLDEKKYTTGDRYFSREYCALEYITMGNTTSQCDIYSLGVIIKEIVTGQKQIRNKDCVIRRWRCRWRKSDTYTPLHVQQITKCIEIAERCTQKEPENRPSSISCIIRDLNESANTNINIPAVYQVPSCGYDDMLGIEPLELRFAFVPNKDISNAIELTNETGNCIAFNIKTASELKYFILPNKGIVLPRSNNIVKITLQAQGTKISGSMRRANEFIVQSTKVLGGLTDEEITEDMFNDEAGKVVDEVNLTVVYDHGPEERQADQSLAEANAPVSEDTKQGRGTKRQRHINFQPTLKIASTTNMNAAKALEGQTVSALTGAMGGLRPKLVKLLDEDCSLEKSVKEGFVVLERQMERMHAGLIKLAHVQHNQLDQDDKVWAKQVRELSYVIEDIIDELIISIERSEPIITNQQQHRLKERIENVTVRVKEVADYKVRHYVDTTHQALSNNVVDPRVPVLHKDHTELVGIDGPRDELVKRLYGDNSCPPTPQLQFISIFGDGGLGKTTLAKATYDMIVKHYNLKLKAFVSVGRKPNMIQVLKNILCQLTKETCADHGDATLLINEVRQVLENERYIIVIDDIWDTGSWNIIECALVDNGKGSRVITTSRIFEVAKNSGEVCKLEPLSYDHSKELLYAKLTSKGTFTCDQPDEKSTKYILGKCGGLPLAIITIASLLVLEPEEDWPEVYTRIGFGHNDTRTENTNKILLFSYNELPCHLKTCLLYLCIFPEDHVVEKNTLVWKWIAEGFVHEERGKTLFEVGEGYFNHLINRSIIQPLEETGCWYDDQFVAPFTIRACRVHDMVLDLIRAIAKEENFVTTLDGEQHLCSQTNKARILAVQKTKLEQHDLAYICKQKVTRSFNATMCDASPRMALALDSLLPSFQVLHVLCLEGVDYVRLYGRKFALGIPTSLAGLRHLRYLGLRGLRIQELPKEIWPALLSLLILDLRDNDIKELPQNITLLRNLKCLLCDTRRGVPVKLPDGMGSLKSMEELQVFLFVGHEPYQGNLGKELGKLTELRVLHINIFGHCGILIDDLVKSLNKLKKLEELDIFHKSEGDELKPWHHYSPCRRLRHLRIVNSEPPAWLNASLRNITLLCLYVESVTEEDLDRIGSLPELRSLILPISRDKDHTIINAGGFRKLQYFHITSSPIFLQGAMPCLESLVFLVNTRSNVHFNFESLHYLPLLDKVRVTVFFREVTTAEAQAIKSALSRAVDTHANRPILDLEEDGFCTDYTHDECLESLGVFDCEGDDYESTWDDYNYEDDDEENQMD